jgi:hypothetical protein
VKHAEYNLVRELCWIPVIICIIVLCGEFLGLHIWHGTIVQHKWARLMFVLFRGNRPSTEQPPLVLLNFGDRRTCQITHYKPIKEIHYDLVGLDVPYTRGGIQDIVHKGLPRNYAGGVNDGWNWWCYWDMRVSCAEIVFVWKLRSWSELADIFGRLLRRSRRNISFCKQGYFGPENLMRNFVSRVQCSTGDRYILLLYPKIAHRTEHVIVLCILVTRRLIWPSHAVIIVSL